MATSTSAKPEPTDILDALNSAGVKASSVEGISLKTFFASLTVAAGVFLIQFTVFVIIKHRLPRIYAPRTYLVPDRERTLAPPSGLFTWLGPIFSTTKSDFIEKCGLDAYFFLRFLRTLLKIFLVLAVVILPVLLPINAIGGRGADFSKRGGPQYNNVTGLDQLAFGNVRPNQTHRYWAHLVLAIFVVIVVCYVFFDELRYYVRLRQRYLMTPAHRLRASATTVLVTGIPHQYCTAKALEELFDIFPGGVRNIWINRNFDFLTEKIILRDQVARQLEGAETRMIQKCKKAHMQQLAREAKKQGQKPTRREKNERQLREDIEGTLLAYQGDGASAGNPHQVKHTVWEATHDEAGHSLAHPKRTWLPGPALGQGIGFVGQRVNQLGRTVRRGLPIWRPGQAQPAAVDGAGDESMELSDREAGEQQPTNPAHAHVTDDPSSVTAAVGLKNDHDVSIPDAPRGPSSELTASTTHDADNVESPTTLKRRNTDDSVASPKRTKRFQFWRRDRSTSDLEVGEKKEKSSDKPGAPSNCSCDSHERFKKPYDPRYENDDDAELDNGAAWKRYISVKDRETMHEPLFGATWLPSFLTCGRKVDTIFHYRRQLAHLNAEIEHDQQHVETFPLMNSAFVQFNNQLAAHMAAQSLTHHMPRQMAPRMVEINPQDVIWQNMSLSWKTRFFKTTLAWLLVAGLVFGWAFPVTFTGLLSQIKALTLLLPWLDWINDMPTWVISVVQGVLPQVMLALLMAVLPMILRLLAVKQGCLTGNSVELTVQNYYFIFLFVQIFLIVSISSGVTTAMRQLLRSVGSAPAILAINLPRASNYFFSYMLLQAFSVSAGALLQIGSLITWFIWAPMVDRTPRERWARQVGIPTMAWGSFFPVYTNLAAIGLIYSVISPLILVFNIVTFAMFWVAYRYNTLFVTRFRFDTGGLMYPRAINQLFVGLYVMELCLIGLFFLVRDEKEEVACQAQAVIMIVVTGLTAGYQKLLHDTFSPLYQFLPVTLEDEAALRDKEFQAEQQRRLLEKEKEDETGAQELTLEERQAQLEERRAQGIETMTEKEFEMKIQHESKHHLRNPLHLKRRNSVDRDLDSSQSQSQDQTSTSANGSGAKNHTFPLALPTHAATETLAELKRRLDEQTKTEINTGRALFSGWHDELQDLSAEERDILVRRAFLHEALRAKRPTVWIPRDSLGVSDDEIHRMKLFSEHIWISNEHTGLDGKCKVVFKKNPPDYSEIDLVEL